jgi:hypothetical protein
MELVAYVKGISAMLKLGINNIILENGRATSGRGFARG